MLLSLFLTCVGALAVSTILLLSVGRRLRIAARPLGLLLAALVAFGAGETVGVLWHLPTGEVRAGQVLTFVVAAAVVLARRDWNPVGQVFFGAFVASAMSYLGFAAWFTVFGGLSVVGALASALLFCLEVLALFLSTTFAFESLDVICRVRWRRQPPAFDPTYLPKVSLQIAAYDEPPDMLIRTIQSVEALDYPNLEIVVIDNNTKDPEVWQPVQAYCRDRPNVIFVHVDPWPGYKSGALNLALTMYTARDAEIVGVVDADYLLDPNYLREVVGSFSDPKVAFVQTPQDYRGWQGDPYLTACYDAYRYFFATSMPYRNERNSIIFAGTMGLIRRSVLEELGGWDEWTITEDAEASLRMLMNGYEGWYVNTPYGRGIMPLTFASLKGQRFRWCFGGMQILRGHWRDLLFARRDRGNRLTRSQRYDYAVGGIQWLNDLVYFGFTVVLAVTAALLLTVGHVGIRPLLGAVVLLPSALIGSGLLRAVWALRERTGIGAKRAILAFLNWLSLSWTVSLACVQGLLRREGVFLRTPKVSERRAMWSAFWSARTETFLALGLWAAGILVALHGKGTPFLLALFGFQGAVYAAAPFMSWLNLRADLSGEMARRRRAEIRRGRRGRRLAVAGAGLGLLAGAAVLAFVLVLGGTHPGRPKDPFAVPRAPGVTTPGPSPTPAPSATPSVTPSATATAPSPTPSVTAPTPTPTAPTPTPTAPTPTTPSPSPSASPTG